MSWSPDRTSKRPVRPAWYVDRDYVTGRALEHLAMVCGKLGIGETQGFIARPRWWANTGLPDVVLVRHGLLRSEAAVVVVLRLEPGSYDLIFIDRAVGSWAVPNLDKRGDDLVSLAAWRWGLNETNAGWRLARLCGLSKPQL